MLLDELSLGFLEGKDHALIDSEAFARLELLGQNELMKGYLTVSIGLI
jgi:hypothetical protein